MSAIWNTILVEPMLNALVALYHLVGNLGISIIAFTIIIRGLLLPVVLPSIKSMKKQRDLQPELQKIQKKYKNDKQKLAKKQMELFEKHGVNPASGCLNQILMIVILIALYSVIRTFSVNIDLNSINDMLYFEGLRFTEISQIHTRFLWLDLGETDPLYIIPVLAGIMQFFASKMMQPFQEKGEKAAKKTPDKKDDMAYNMQKQMLFLMPLMTVFIGVSLPSGAALYILTTTIFSLFQQYFVSGLGGLKEYARYFRKKA